MKLNAIAARKLRELKSLTQDELAAESGVSRSQIGLWEAGYRELPDKYQKNLQRVLLR